MAYVFKPLQTSDLGLVNGWRLTPAVAAWWSGEIDEDDLADPASRQWIVSHDGRPFAYLQDYDPHAETDHPFAGLPAGSRGLDQFIGEPDMLGRGHGPAFLDMFAERLFAEGAPALGVDPSPDNARAVRAYEKAGFRPGETCDTPWGRCLLMTRRSKTTVETFPFGACEDLDSPGHIAEFLATHAKAGGAVSSLD